MITPVLSMRGSPVLIVTGANFNAHLIEWEQDYLVSFFLDAGDLNITRFYKTKLS